MSTVVKALGLIFKAIYVHNTQPYIASHTGPRPSFKQGIFEPVSACTGVTVIVARPGTSRVHCTVRQIHGYIVISPNTRF
jgi:hypothetical protein